MVLDVRTERRYRVEQQAHWWHHLLHNLRPARLRPLPKSVVTDLPFGNSCHCRCVSCTGMQCAVSGKSSSSCTWELLAIGGEDLAMTVPNQHIPNEVNLPNGAR